MLTCVDVLECFVDRDRHVRQLIVQDTCVHNKHIGFSY